MKIVLLRHGRPQLLMRKKMTGAEFINWINQYNSAPLDDSYPPPDDSVTIAEKCNASICSTLRRSIESADKLALSDRVVISDDFIEAGLPCFNLFNVTFSANVWLVIFRISWFLGYSPNSESYAHLKERAKRCSDQLMATAKEKESVIFVGHGILNRVIAKELGRRGWLSDSKKSNDYWRFSVFKKPSI